MGMRKAKLREREEKSNKGNAVRKSLQSPPIYSTHLLVPMRQFRYMPFFFSI
jgi:hypothetical protein